jgi:hypothetical protein
MSYKWFSHALMVRLEGIQGDSARVAVIWAHPRFLVRCPWVQCCGACTGVLQLHWHAEDCSRLQRFYSMRCLSGCPACRIVSMQQAQHSCMAASPICYADVAVLCAFKEGVCVPQCWVEQQQGHSMAKLPECSCLIGWFKALTAADLRASHLRQVSSCLLRIRVSKQQIRPFVANQR